MGLEKKRLSKTLKYLLFYLLHKDLDQSVVYKIDKVKYCAEIFAFKKQYAILYVYLQPLKRKVRYQFG